MTRSKSKRKVFVKTPGGRTTVHLKEKMGTRPSCPQTGVKLQGVGVARSATRAQMHKGTKRPSRPFGGMLSSSAARREHIRRARTTQE